MFGYGVWKGWGCTRKPGYKNTRSVGIHLCFFLIAIYKKNRFHSARVPYSSSAQEPTNALHPTIPLLLSSALQSAFDWTARWGQAQSPKANHLFCVMDQRQQKKLGCICMFVWCSCMCSTYNAHHGSQSATEVVKVFYLLSLTLPLSHSLTLSVSRVRRRERDRPDLRPSTTTDMKLR